MSGSDDEFAQFKRRYPSSYRVLTYLRFRVDLIHPPSFKQRDGTPTATAQAQFASQPDAVEYANKLADILSAEWKIAVSRDGDLLLLVDGRAPHTAYHDEMMLNAEQRQQRRDTDRGWRVWEWVTTHIARD